MTFTCPECGEEYPFGAPDVSVAVFWNNTSEEDREDFTETLCPECAERALGDLIDLHEQDGDEEGSA